MPGYMETDAAGKPLRWVSTDAGSPAASVPGPDLRCEDFGADPNQTAAENTRAIQNALYRGGTASLTRPGFYRITAMPEIPQGSGLYIGHGVTVEES